MPAAAGNQHADTFALADPSPVTITITLPVAFPLGISVGIRVTVGVGVDLRLDGRPERRSQYLFRSERDRHR